MVVVAACAVLLCMSACDDSDSFSSSASNTLTFTTDTLAMDTLFSSVASPTYTFWAHNNSGDGIVISQARLQRGNQTGFRVNIDGEYLDNTLGSVATNIKVRKGDSIRVFVELTARTNDNVEPQLVEDNLLFTLESGVTQSVNLRAYSWDATIADSLIIHSDTTIASTKPIIINGGIRVDSAATLTILSPTTLYFHDSAGMDIYGTLVVKGEAGADVTMRGDRTDHMFDYLPYDRVSGQWRGLRFYPSSWGNSMQFADIHSATDGIICDSCAYDSIRTKITLDCVTIHNCKGVGFASYNAPIVIQNSQVTNTLGDCVAIYGGRATIVYCTFAQFYPFDADRGAALRFTNFVGDYPYPLHLVECYNTLITGYEEDVIYGEMNDTTVAFLYYFRNSILRTEKPDTATLASGLYNDIIWEASTDSVQGKSHFATIDEDNLIYNFALDSTSTARHGAISLEGFTYDRTGAARKDTADIGAYEYY